MSPPTCYLRNARAHPLRTGGSRVRIRSATRLAAGAADRQPRVRDFVPVVTSSTSCLASSLGGRAGLLGSSRHGHSRFMGAPTITLAVLAEGRTVAELPRASHELRLAHQGLTACGHERTGSDGGLPRERDFGTHARDNRDTSRMRRVFFAAYFQRESKPVRLRRSA